MDGSDGVKLMTWVSTMTQRMDSKRREVADGFLVHTCVTSWSKVTAYSYILMPALGIGL